MARDIWLNLPAKDLARSIAFFSATGFVRNPGTGFSDSDGHRWNVLFTDAGGTPRQATPNPRA